MPETDQQPDAIILAAGRGKRMGADKAKVLFEVGGRPMLWWVIKACREAGVQRCVVVVGYQSDLVQKAMGEFDNVQFVLQREQLGTAHAVSVTKPLFENAQKDVFVLAGDGPLIQSQTLKNLLSIHRQNQSSATLATALLNNPEGYGRIIRDSQGNFAQIVEQKDATTEQRNIKEINPSYYCFKSEDLFSGLEKVGTNNKQNEYYLTDVPEILQKEGKKVFAQNAVAADDVLSINTPQQLAEVEKVLAKRQNNNLETVLEKA